LTTSPHQKWAVGILRKQLVPGSWNILLISNLSPFTIIWKMGKIKPSIHIEFYVASKTQAAPPPTCQRIWP
jgi:hypothetical protein